jgi:hypothetical protein
MPVVQRALLLVCMLTLVSCGEEEAPTPRTAPGPRAAPPGIPLLSGERVPGCWIGIGRSVAASGSPLHWPASVGNGTYVGGCVRWPR